MKKEWVEFPDDELNFYEEMLVALLGTLSPGGYNLKEGGGNGKPCEEAKQKMSESHLGEKNHMFGKTHTDDAKKKLSEKMSGENNPMFGKTHTDDTKRKMSCENNPMFGKTHPDEVKQKISKAHKGKILTKEHKKKISENQPASKIVYQYELDGTFLQSFISTEEAARSLKKKEGSSIRQCIRGKCKTAYGFKWSYIELL